MRLSTVQQAAMHRLARVAPRRHWISQTTANALKRHGLIAGDTMFELTAKGRQWVAQFD